MDVTVEVTYLLSAKWKSSYVYVKEKLTESFPLKMSPLVPTSTETLQRLNKKKKWKGIGNCINLASSTTSVLLRCRATLILTQLTEKYTTKCSLLDMISHYLLGMFWLWMNKIKQWRCHLRLRDTQEHFSLFLTTNRRDAIKLFQIQYIFAFALLKYVLCFKHFF